MTLYTPEHVAVAVRIAPVIVVLIALYSAIEHVPDGHRHALLVGGEYRRTLEPGDHLTLPFLSAGFCLEGPDSLPIPTAEVVDGEDGVVLGTTVVWRITNAEAAFAEANDPRRAIHDAALECRRGILRGVEIGTLRRDLDEVEARLERALAVEAGRWGVAIEGVDLERRADDADTQETIPLYADSEEDVEQSEK